ncbi:coenzyme F420-0:L-glutamate ligase [Salinibacterium sp. NSLL150]|uniref:coenzyme F420-0:L-glutamate ligase n=1 Tax=unclassified Salinibacterium TaxID=2632331 RepID=UPI0018CD1D7D|nr:MULTISPECIES: coenzyme F420-0:L-glutamate ligase [unclassified Salinibacterium]MBH0099008.1 coenzyme F420-0:L-glutamate ligase [Salinibacterium sp. NSLL35]MBH0101762.1 coenzyme F420-0:L-glutamate ligase [Salinibacterium sp. NSLL150]MBH0104522.1 coenzyme F420-0:L-glutamate ligase [Salinibacterium sp. NSLL16]MBH0107282.1 coenzyme F420-0:L-glutamate ligase [Salinibacterium sp. NSLL17]
MGAEANAGKSLTVEVDGAVYERLPIKTRLVVREDDIVQVVSEYASSVVQDGDLFFVTEKIVGITQGRAYPISEVEPRKLATFLSKYVTKTSHGIGLGMPETMEMALRECGTPRILFAAAVAAVTKLVGRRGDFYRIAGPKARAIDGPTKNTIPPYNSHVVLGPARPDGVAQDIKVALGRNIEVLVVDINDFGGNILGSTTTKANNALALKVLKDNPLGQDHQSTPLGVIRRA